MHVAPVGGWPPIGSSVGWPKGSYASACGGGPLAFEAQNAWTLNILRIVSIAAIRSVVKFVIRVSLLSFRRVGDGDKKSFSKIP